MPFFDPAILRLQEEEWSDILPADIHYLAYLDILTTEEEKPIFFFNTSFLIELTDKVFEYLEKKEEILVTDFYKDFLVRQSDINKL